MKTLLNTIGYLVLFTMLCTRAGTFVPADFSTGMAMFAVMYAVTWLATLAVSIFIVLLVVPFLKHRGRIAIGKAMSAWCEFLLFKFL